MFRWLPVLSNKLQTHFDQEGIHKSRQLSLRAIRKWFITLKWVLALKKSCFPQFTSSNFISINYLLSPIERVITLNGSTMFRKHLKTGHPNWKLQYFQKIVKARKNWWGAPVRSLCLMLWLGREWIQVHLHLTDYFRLVAVDFTIYLLTGRLNVVVSISKLKTPNKSLNPSVTSTN